MQLGGRKTAAERQTLTSWVRQELTIITNFPFSTFASGIFMTIFYFFNVWPLYVIKLHDSPYSPSRRRLFRLAGYLYDLDMS